MYELPSSFCPYEVGVGVGGAQLLLYPIAVRVGVGRVAGAALRQTHVGIISIEQILAALVVLDMKGTELAVQLLCRDTQLLRYLRGGIAGNRVEHIVGVERLRQKMIHLILQLDDVLTVLGDANHLFVHHTVQPTNLRILFSDEFLLLINLHLLVFQQILLLLECSSENLFSMPNRLLITLALLYRNITARLANLWQHLGSNPVFELHRRWKLGAEHQSIESALVDEKKLAPALCLTSILLDTSRYPYAVFYSIMWVN